MKKYIIGIICMSIALIIQQSTINNQRKTIELWKDTSAKYQKAAEDYKQIAEIKAYEVSILRERK